MIKFNKSTDCQILCDEFKPILTIILFKELIIIENECLLIIDMNNDINVNNKQFDYGFEKISIQTDKNESKVLINSGNGLYRLN